MKIEFRYNIDKDIENFTKTLNSVNNKEYTRFHELYIQKYGYIFDEKLIKKFIEESAGGMDIKTKLSEIENSWFPIQDEYVKRVEKIFGIKSPFESVRVYLTTNERCAYNIDGNYFFVYLESKSTNRIIMHELFHFYTWHALHSELEEKGVSKERYNNIKESLTELLNIEFADLLGNFKDKGYLQHQEIRAQIRILWLKDKNIKNLVAQILDN